MTSIRFLTKMSPFQRVLLALILGILTGLFVGESAGILKVGGTIYIRLLQMTVLPYVLVSIIAGLGRLDSTMATNIGIKAVKIILFMWLAVMLTLTLLPLAYPTWVTAGFFSASQNLDPVNFDFVDLYIPYNIFSSLSNTIVPAVVLFSILMGIGLISAKNKAPFISIADNVSDGLQRVASFIAVLAPLGIFAIAASAAGTLQPEELGRLQVFLWVYLIAASLLGFVLLPLLVHWATPFSYREVLSVAGEAMITALATGTVLVVLPMIAERCKELLKKHNMECEETDSTVAVMVPTAYSFPSTGTMLGLGFILFSGWYTGLPLDLKDYPSFIVMGVFSAFGSMAIAIPFLLDYFGLAADQFQLYLLGSVITGRFATALAALHGFVVTLLVASAVLNRLSWRKMIQAIGLHLSITAGVVILVGISLTYLIPYEYTGARKFEAMRLDIKPGAIESISSPTPLSEQDQARPRLEIIRERGSIRIGYYPDRLPFAFINDQGDVVGFDIEMMHELARDLGIKIEIFRLNNLQQEPRVLSDGSLDIAVGGGPSTPLRALDVAFSDFYTHNTLGFIVADSKRDQFDTIDHIAKTEGLHLGIPNFGYYKKAVQKLLPNATLITINKPRDFLKGKYPDVDAYIFSAETGAAWTMLYPNYSSVVAEGPKVKLPRGFALPKSQSDFVQFINTWLALKQDDGFRQQAYNYWILGENPKEQHPRWSIMKNVLGWGEEPIQE